MFSEVLKEVGNQLPFQYEERWHEMVEDEHVTLDLGIAGS